MSKSRTIGSNGCSFKSWKCAEQQRAARFFGKREMIESFG
jgi:hypothetical protein